MIIVRPIVNILFVIYNYVGDFGLAIIVFALIIRLAMWPLVKKQLHQARAMRKIGPELAEIRKRTKGNKTMEQIQMLDLYKRNNIKPFNSILTLLIQLPIFFALFSAINVMVLPQEENRSIEHSAYSFVADMPRIREAIENHDEFRPRLFGVVDLGKKATTTPWSIDSAIILLFCLASAFSQYYISKQQMPTGSKPKKSFKEILKESAASGDQPDQSEINSVVTGQMTKFMPIMMFVFMISVSGALSFYYLIGNLVMIVQQKIILKRNVQEMDDKTDKAILKELNDIKEAQVVSGVKETKSKKNITRISVPNNKKRR
jgi:YidC/Oxa1 family membrane protein insertase